MRVEKDGVSRNIDPKNEAIYIAKGYKPGAEPAKKQAAKKDTKKPEA